MSRSGNILTGAVALLCVALALYTAHRALVAREVAAMREELVSQAELAAVEAERQLLARRLKATAEANAELSEKMNHALREAQAFEEELADYAAQIDTDPSCVVDPDLFRRLQ